MKKAFYILPILLLGCQSTISATDLGIEYVHPDEQFQHYINEELGFEFYYYDQIIDVNEGLLSEVVLFEHEEEIIISDQVYLDGNYGDHYWPIYYGYATNKEEINAWIGRHFFTEGCQIGEMTDWNEDGIYEISVTWPEDPEQMGAFKCTGPIGSWTLYNPDKNSIVHYVSKPNDSSGKSVIDGSNVSLIPYGFSWLD
jgi:hypothetical protein